MSWTGLSRATITVGLVACFVLRLPWEGTQLIHEDAETFTSAARLLVETGSLKEFGHQFPFQALRPTGEAQPFYYGSLATVLWLFPFFKFFGSTDRVYFCSQIFLLFVLFGVLAKRYGLRSAVWLVGLGSALKTWDVGLSSSATTFPAVLFMVGLWGFWEWGPSRRRAVGLGMLIALGASFRPTVYYLNAMAGFFWLRSKRVSELLALGIGNVATILVLAYLRNSLGAGPDDDYKFFNMGSFVFAFGLETISLPDSIPISQMFSNPTYFRALLHKFVGAFKNFVMLRSFYFSRVDCLLIWICLTGLISTHLDWRKYVPVLGLLAFALALIGLVFDSVRYYDVFSTVMLVQLVVDPHLRQFVFERRRPMTVLCGVCLAIFGWRAGKERLQQLIETRAVVSSFQKLDSVPREGLAFVDRPHFWNWYLAGRKSCSVAYSSPRIMAALLEKFPAAPVILFYPNDRLFPGVVEAIAARRVLSMKNPDLYLPR